MRQLRCELLNVLEVRNRVAAKLDVLVRRMAHRHGPTFAVVRARSVLPSDCPNPTIPKVDYSPCIRFRGRHDIDHYRADHRRARSWISLLDTRS